MTDQELIERHIVNLLKSNYSADKLAPKYLIFSYAYYIHNESFIQDDIYDAICHYLLEHYEELSDGWKRYLDKESLSAGTGFNLEECDYPNFCRRIVASVLKKGWCFTECGIC